MIVSHTHKYVFISMPKVCTNTLYTVLREHYEGERRGGFHQRVPPQGCEGYFWFSIVRNPYSRAVSLWWSTSQRKSRKYPEFRKHGKTLEMFMDWLVNGSGRNLNLGSNQCRWMNRIPRLVDFVLKMESLPADFVRMNWVRSGNFIWPKENTTDDVRGPWQEYVTPNVKALVEEWAAGDFEQFKYEKVIV